MVREAIATGETVEQAFENACVQLGVETVEAEFEVLELPEKKKLGLFGGKPAKVRAYIQSSPAQAAADYLQDLLQKMGLENVEISIHEEKNEEGKYIRRERYTGAVSRSFFVGKDLTEEDIKARFENGILHIALPKEAPKKIEENKYIAIEG